MDVTKPRTPGRKPAVSRVPTGNRAARGNPSDGPVPEANRGQGTSHLAAGFLAGLVAALLMTLMMVVLRATLGISPTPEMGPDRVAPLMPISLFFWFLGVLGGYNEAKQFGVGSILLGQLAVGALFGLLYAQVVERSGARDADRRAVGRSGALLVGATLALIWTLSLVLLWPTLGTSYRGLPPTWAAVATAIGLLVSYATYGAALMLAYRFITGGAPARPSTAGGAPNGRRALLVGGAGVVLALASGGVLRRLFDLATFSYDGRRYTDPSLPPITPTDQFYSVTKNVIDPSVNRSLWRFEITGLVDRAASYRFEDLAAMPAMSQEATLMCISNGVGDALMSNAAWKGIPLRGLLEAAGPRSGAAEVVLRAVDGYTATVPLEKAMQPTTMIVYEMNGEPLPERHGYPVRLIVPGAFGVKNVKWVTQIELVDRDVRDFYEQQGWGPNFVVPIRTRFFAPDFDQPLRLGTAVPLKGIAFAGDQGISRVEVSMDDGRSWQEAGIDYAGPPTAWSTWRHEWRPTQAGEYRLAVRAYDAAGRPQESENRSIVSEGARGYHWVTARVEA